MKRALGLEGVGAEDKKEGKAQVIETISELNKYSEKQEELKEWLYRQKSRELYSMV